MESLLDRTDAGAGLQLEVVGLRGNELQGMGAGAIKGVGETGAERRTSLEKSLSAWGVHLVSLKTSQTQRKLSCGAQLGVVMDMWPIQSPFSIILSSHLRPQSLSTGSSKSEPEIRFLKIDEGLQYFYLSKCDHGGFFFFLTKANFPLAVSSPRT